MDSKTWIDLLQLAVGIVLLVFSGDYLIKGGVSIANRFRIPNLVIGLTVVAFGTSAPELIVSMGAAFTNHPEIALGNVIGSNIANIALVLAVTVVILPMPVAASTVKRSWPVMFIASLALYLAMVNNLIGRWEGALMFFFLILFVVDSIHYHKKYEAEEHVVFPQPKYKTTIAVFIVLLASIGLAAGSHFLIGGASGIAADLGVSERIISLTVVAFGTSIPELTASVIAAIKKESDISVGNIVGSNIFNVFAVIGLTAIVKPIGFSFAEFRIDLIYMLVIALLLFVFMFPWSRFAKNRNEGVMKQWKMLQGGKIGRSAGILLMIVYFVYLYSII
jgi:cation:H+ antiporter